MEDEEYLKDLVFRFKKVLDSKKEYLKCFHEYGVQVEGWLKGELLRFLDNEKNAKRIFHFDREVSPGKGRKKVDLRIKIPTGPDSAVEAWIELKHWLIGYQKGTYYNAQFYFGDKSSVGIKPDVEKLSSISSGDKFLLILTTKNPKSDWSTGVTKFNRKFSSLHLRSLTNPADFPNFYYLGLLKVV